MGLFGGFLLEKGAIVNAQGETYGNTLSAASRFGNEGVVRHATEVIKIGSCRVISPKRIRIN